MHELAMSTSKQTIEFILSKLRDHRFTARAMFGEYALYVEGKVVALVCDDRLYVKIVPAAQALETECEKGNPYPGAKLHYLIEEGQLSTIHDLPALLLAVARSRPEKKRRRTGKK
jgi:DNA transformation protein